LVDATVVITLAGGHGRESSRFSIVSGCAVLGLVIKRTPVLSGQRERFLLTFSRILCSDVWPTNVIVMHFSFHKGSTIL